QLAHAGGELADAMLSLGGAVCRQLCIDAKAVQLPSGRGGVVLRPPYFLAELLNFLLGVVEASFRGGRLPLQLPPKVIARGLELAQASLKLSGVASRPCAAFRALATRDLGPLARCALCARRGCDIVLEPPRPRFFFLELSLQAVDSGGIARLGELG